MNAWPDAPAIRSFLARVSRRLAWLAVVEGAAAGLALALLLVVVGLTGRQSIGAGVAAGVALAAAGGALRLAFSAHRRRRAAHLVERRAPECRNLVVTAAELLERPARVSAYIGAVVCRDAARRIGSLDVPTLFPASRGLGAFGAVAALWIAAIVFVSGRPATLSGSAAPPAPDAAAIAHVNVVITPPEYTGRKVQSLRDPARIDALEGSRIGVTVEAEASAVAVETMNGREPLRAGGARVFTGDVTADADGYLAIEPTSATGRAGVRRLIGLSVTPDRPPRVRVTAPGRDLFLSDARRSVDLALEADDDLGLASLRLRYTKVSGSDENFTFTEGEAPLVITRATDQAWTARGVLKLDALGLQPGDMVVYRGVAGDKRPGAAATESDTFIIEITAPGSMASEGFAIDDQKDRYAFSQQMVILKTERLAARRATLSPADFADEAAGIAAEQRQVRAEFVFMMGGELADAGLDMTQLNEEQEAQGEGDLAAGYGANQGRLDLLRAIRSMSAAATLLATAELTPALTAERAALASLMRAFARSRYILRALTERERLDLSRRLTGVLAAISRAPRPAVEIPPNPRLAGLREALAGIAALAASPALTSDGAARAAALAQAVLQIDPSAAALQQVAAALTDAGSALARGSTADAGRKLDEAATGLAAVARAELLEAPRATLGADVDRLSGALADALRRARGPR